MKAAPLVVLSAVVCLVASVTLSSATIATSRRKQPISYKARQRTKGNSQTTAGLTREVSRPRLRPSTSKNKHTKLLVVSFDGFRQLYFTNRFLPWFSYFRQQGLYSTRVQSIFPSETFPNHYAIVTGRYAESHGIVANDMYDPPTMQHFSVENTDPYWWNNGRNGSVEPIWVTARKQGIRTAVSLWPGSAVVFPGNLTADFYRPIYDLKVPYETRIDEVLGHLAHDDAQLGLLYYNRPDVEGHYNGTASSAVHAALRELDWYLSYILRRSEELGLGRDRLNIIICADHGMANITKQLYLNSYVDMKLIEQVPSYGAVTNIQPKRGATERVYQSLKAAADQTKLFRVYKKTHMPLKLHYSNNRRIMDIVLISNVGVYMSPTPLKKYKKTASHGYDPKWPKMQPIFLARGPAFKTGGYRVKKSFRTKDIYAIMTHIIGMEPFPNNATFTDVAEVFRDGFPNSSASSLLLSGRTDARNSFVAWLVTPITAKIVYYHLSWFLPVILSTVFIQ